MKYTLLIVEDEPALRDLFNAVLGSAGCSVLLAEDGQQALAMAEQVVNDMPLVLLTDIMLPGLNGHELAKEFLRRYPRTRVGFVTGWFDKDLIRLGICPDCSCLLRKPFELSDLRRFLDRILLQPVCEELFGRFPHHCNTTQALEPLQPGGDLSKRGDSKDSR